MTIHSHLYVGTIRHRRFRPTAHAFRYRIYMAYLDLAELPTVFARRWFWSADRRNLAAFHRRDYLGDPAVPLDTAVRDRVEAETGRRPTGPIRLLTHLRHFGYSFNPVSFYYCFDEAGTHLDTIVAEITNTPWGERHAYVLPVTPARNGHSHRFRFDKTFHVSPFLPMAMGYDWRFTDPGDHLTVHMINRMQDARHFDATLQMTRRPLTAWTMAWALLRFPLITAGVALAIYWQALRLWLQRTPFFEHPDRRTAAMETPRP